MNEETDYLLQTIDRLEDELDHAETRIDTLIVQRDVAHGNLQRATEEITSLTLRLRDLEDRIDCYE